MTRSRKRHITGPLRLALGLALAFTGAGAADDTDTRGDAPYVTTPPEVVDGMLRMADVGSDDIVYDLGSGDGRIPIAAVRDFGARRGVGIEIDPELVQESRANAVKAGVAQRTRFITGDIYETEFSEASVVTLFLFPQVNRELRPRILSRLAPGTRVVSHRFGMGQWEPDASAWIGESRIHMWRVPADIAGRWRWDFDGTTYRMVVGQQFQKVLGEVRAEGKRSRIRLGELTGRQLRVEAPVPGRADAAGLILEGRVEDGRIRGTVTVAGNTEDITAVRGE